MRKLILLVITVIAVGCSPRKKQKETAMSTEKTPAAQEQTIYGFQVTDLYGEPFDFSNLKGKKIMVVNTASECGLTPQYEQLQQVFETYGGDDFTIVGFPANNFGAQEPGSNQEIAAFCKQNYGVSFPMMAKISVKGEDMHPVYRFLTQLSENGYADSEVQWNFQKYLIDEEGKVVRVVEPQVLPDDESIIEWITSK